MNLRERIGELKCGSAITKYSNVVREERYFCAILFHLIQTCISHKAEQSLRMFLCKCGVLDSEITESTLKNNRAAGTNIPSQRRRLTL